MQKYKVLTLSMFSDDDKARFKALTGQPYQVPGVPTSLCPCRNFMGSAVIQGRTQRTFSLGEGNYFQPRRCAWVLAGNLLTADHGRVLTRCGREFCVEPTHLFTGRYYRDGAWYLYCGHSVASNFYQGRCRVCFREYRGAWERLNAQLMVRARRVLNRLQRARRKGNLPWRDVTLDEVVAGMQRHKIGRRQNRLPKA